eukprot:1161047-Pelagomonas_calceolata.AAC.33
MEELSSCAAYRFQEKGSCQLCAMNCKRTCHEPISIPGSEARQVDMPWTHSCLRIRILTNKV